MREPPSILAGGEPVALLPQRAVWWPRARTLIAADLHLGKEHAFGALGIAIPGGVLEETLERLARCARQWGAERVVVVGDLLHARLGTTPRVIETVARWRASLEAEIWLVPGNHDRAHDLVAEPWRLRVCTEMAPGDAAWAIAGDRIVRSPAPRPADGPPAGKLRR